MNAFCRQKGIFTHHLETWKKAFLLSQQSVTKTASAKVLRDEVKHLKKELNRKEKALAETAALLVLQKSSTRYGRKRGDDDPLKTQTDYRLGGYGHPSGCKPRAKPR